ncbi:ABC transporter permease [Bifidobacterium catulorum]|uniref:ABC transporter permease n=1 Tax=Bifidobacterium catulorum TaxID=1630173 RepID=A0A2U2MSE0_9BIFI|nr:ABC transporter permease [Bifidobacterium catulorum]PWG59750.1 ABC transporter permease [Bifidobacterium catulorum]
MFSITIRMMKRSARMLVPAGIAIVIGTAFIAATLLFGNAMNDTLKRMTTAQYGDANYSIGFDTSIADADDADMDYLYSRTVSDFHPERLRAVEGVKGLRFEARAEAVATNGDSHANVFAVTTASERGLLPVTVTQGAQPSGDGQAALQDSTAKQLGVRVGDDITLASKGASHDMRARVVGLTRDDAGAYPYYGGASLLSDDLMAAMNGVSDFGRVNATTAYLDIDGDPAAVKTTVDTINRILPKRFTAQSRDKAAKAAVKSLSGGDTDIVTTFLLGFGALAMLVAALVIANTFQVLVAQRRRTLALLRTIGAGKGQLYASVLFEAGLLGLVASVLGVGLGLALMAAVTASGLTSSIGMAMRLVLDWRVFVVPIAFGVVMTVIASLSSARTATSVTPLEALRPMELSETRRTGVVRGALSALMLAGGLAMCAYAAWQMSRNTAGQASMVDDHYSTVLVMAVGGCALVFLGLIVSAVYWLPRALHGAGAFASLAGPSARIAHANIQKNPRRVAATGAALLIGVTLVSTIATGAASGKATMGEALASRYSVDMIASGDDMTDARASKAAKVKGVTASIYAPTATMNVKDTHGTTITTLVVGVDGADTLRKVMHADLGDTAIGNGTILMPHRSAFGGKDFVFRNGRVELTPASVSPASGDTATSDDARDGKGALTLDVRQADYRRVSADYAAVAFVNIRHFTDGDLKTDGHMMLMRIDADKAGTTLNDVFTGVQSAFADSAGITVTGPIAERAQWETMIDAMMAMLVGLIAVAVLIALVGVANTLSLSVIERTRESATLRAIGMTRGQLRRSLAIEALLLALVSGLAGVALGTGFGWLGSYMVFSLYGTVVFPFDWAVNGATLGIAALAALLASVAPARRAVKTPPVEALAEA